MNTFAPAACSVRAISAPMRRAPPVISTTRPGRSKFSLVSAMRRNDTARPGEREPTLDAAAAEHGRRARAHLADQIAAAGGWLSFERFMDLALYAPNYGYYS